MEEGVFYPEIQRLDRKHRGLKAAIFGVLVGGAFWIFEGKALYRRVVVGVAGVPAAQRTGEGFLALSFPRITEESERFTMAQKDFAMIIQGLRKQGFVSIGIEDVRRFYQDGVALPPRAVLIALDRDNPESVTMADEVLKDARMRALLFLNKTRPPGVKGPYRLALTPHAITQLKKTDAWDIGWVADHPPERMRGEPIRPPVLDSGEDKHEWTRNPFAYPMRFIVSRTGYNDGGRMMSALRILRVRTDKPADENLRLVSASWPRRKPFSDDFKKNGLVVDWINERGVGVAVGGRLVLVPTPRQTTASVYLAGTDSWRDSVSELTLAKYKRGAWMHVRAAEGRWLRLGALNGYWYLQQKTGPGHKPRTIARAPMTVVTSLPARVRLVVKGPWAIVHVNGRMQFGKAVRVHSGLDRGRIELDVYDEKAGRSLAVVTSFAAAPLREHWLSVDREPIAGDTDREKRLWEDVRDRAVFASVLSPRWLDVLADGRLSPTDQDRELLRQLAGYYRLQLVPMLDFATPQARLPVGSAEVARVVEEIDRSLRGSEAVGVNLRLSGGRADAAQAAYFLNRLRHRLHGQKRRLWITLDGSAKEARWAKEADGVLRAVDHPVPGAVVLERIP